MLECDGGEVGGERDDVDGEAISFCRLLNELECAARRNDNPFVSTTAAAAAFLSNPCKNRALLLRTSVAGVAAPND